MCECTPREQISTNLVHRAKPFQCHHSICRMLALGFGSCKPTSCVIDARQKGRQGRQGQAGSAASNVEGFRCKACGFWGSSREVFYVRCCLDVAGTEQVMPVPGIAAQMCGPKPQGMNARPTVRQRLYMSKARARLCGNNC